MSNQGDLDVFPPLKRLGLYWEGESPWLWLSCTLVERLEQKDSRLHYNGQGR
jgi:hypothetical protein